MISKNIIAAADIKIGQLVAAADNYQVIATSTAGRHANQRLRLAVYVQCVTPVELFQSTKPIIGIATTNALKGRSVTLLIQGSMPAPARLLAQLGMKKRVPFQDIRSLRVRRLLRNLKRH